MQLSAIHRFPVKSCRGEAVESAVVEPWGLAGDRRWMLVDDDGMLVTAREQPRLMLAVPELRPDGSLRLSGPDLPDLEVGMPTDRPLETVHVWKTDVDARIADDAAGAWFGRLLGESVRLAYLDDPTRRPVDPHFAQTGDVVSFADGYPLLLATTTSLDALNDLIAAGNRPEEGPLPMDRFRPNLVVDGSAAWAEDGWRRIRVGEAEFRLVKGCERCVMTTTDPWTVARGKEPIATLARHRRWDGKTWFAMNLIPDSPGAVVRVGDEVEILEPDPDGPPR
jgi:uncharacterized protein YcbX